MVKKQSNLLAGIAGRFAVTRGLRAGLVRSAFGECSEPARQGDPNPVDHSSPDPLATIESARRAGFLARCVASLTGERWMSEAYRNPSGAYWPAVSHRPKQGSSAIGKIKRARA